MKLQLRVPVWVTSLAPLVAPSTLVCASAHRHIRLYDIRSKRRPVQSSALEGHSLTTVAVASSGSELVVGDGMGCLRVIDLRTMKPKLRLFGPAGSIRSLVCHDEQPFVASCGLDRYVRVQHFHRGIDERIISQAEAKLCFVLPRRYNLEVSFNSNTR